MRGQMTTSVRFFLVRQNEAVTKIIQRDGVGTVPYNIQHNGTVSGEVHPFWQIFIVTLCRKMDAEFGNRKKPSGFLFPKLYFVYSEGEIHGLCAILSSNNIAQKKSRQMCKQHPQGSSRSRTLGTASGAVCAYHGFTLKKLYEEK